jgi:hypothetical protein
MTHEDCVWAALGLPDKTPRPAAPVLVHVESVTTGTSYYLPVQYHFFNTATVIPSITSYVSALA